jgi:anti-sigma B factor antagonist
MSVAEPQARAGNGFEVRVEPAREVVRIKPTGELDLATAPELRDHVIELLAVGFEQLIIDLRGLSFIDVAGVRLLLELADRARCEDWKLSLIQAGDRVARIFVLTDTVGQLPFAPSRRASSGTERPD